MKPELVQTIKVLLKKIEKNLTEIRLILDNSNLNLKPGKNRKIQAMALKLEGAQESLNRDEKIIEGIFNGQNMISQDGQEYPIPPNYASKSKLVEGDLLKLTIQEDGSFVYKQIKPIERKKIRGTLMQNDKGEYSVLAEGKNYKVLLASITYFKGEAGDEVVLIVPKNQEAEWGAVEGVIKLKEKEKELSLGDLEEISSVEEEGPEKQKKRARKDEPETEEQSFPPLEKKAESVSSSNLETEEEKELPNLDEAQPSTENPQEENFYHEEEIEEI